MRYEELRDALRARSDLEAGVPLPPKEIDAAARSLGISRTTIELSCPHEVFGLGVDIPKYLDVVRVNASEWAEGRLPRHLVAVMNDGAGNLSCIDQTAIVLWDHESSPTKGSIPLAPSFSDLLSRLLLDE